jgi:phospholipid/cholesterol/gamma-HCH transport system substrate-binding protein
MGKAATTLSAGSPDLFGAVRNLNDFVGALDQNDAQVREFTNQLSSFSNLLSDNRKQLGDMLDHLDSAVDKVESFTNDNRSAIHKNVVALRNISETIAEKRQSLAGLIHIAPTAAEDFFHIYNPDTGALTGVLADSQLASPAQTMCSAIYSAGGKPEDCIKALSPFADLVRQYHLPILGMDPSSPGALPAIPRMPLPGGN